MTKKEVFEELLSLYQDVSEAWINEYSWNIDEAEKTLKEEIEEWKEDYEKAD